MINNKGQKKKITLLDGELEDISCMGEIWREKQEYVMKHLE